MPFTPLDRPGRFKFQPISFSLKENQETGAVNVTVCAKVLAYWDEEEKKWDDWSEYAPMDAYGNVNLVMKRKDGEAQGQFNATMCKQAVQAFGWGGDIKQFLDTTWVATPFQGVVKENEYNGKKSFRIDSYYTIDSDPQQRRGSIDQSRIASIDERFGSQFRAIASNATNNKPPPPASKPATPPPAPPPRGSLQPES